MSASSKIEWTDATWNPMSGCTKVSAGCANCYAERFAMRLKAAGNPSYQNGFEVTTHPKALDQPLRWRRPRMVFVCSMGDLFHPDVPDLFIRDVFDVMADCEQHTFQVLTKRIVRAAELGLSWPANVWLGVSIENGAHLSRRDVLVALPAAVKFISFEPLLGRIDTLQQVITGIDWVIVGGETGPAARPLVPSWAREIRDACVARGVPFFFKQWGDRPVVPCPRGGRRWLDGREWNEMPVAVGGAVDG